MLLLGDFFNKYINTVSYERKYCILFSKYSKYKIASCKKVKIFELQYTKSKFVD
jgi:hypothetical protein